MRMATWLFVATPLIASCTCPANPLARREPHQVTATFTAEYVGNEEACTGGVACEKFLSVTPDRFEIVEKNGRTEHRYLYQNGKLFFDGSETPTRAAFVDLLGRRKFWQLSTTSNCKATGETRTLCGRRAQLCRENVDDNDIVTYRFDYWLDTETKVVLDANETTFVDGKASVVKTWACRSISYSTRP